MGNGAELPPGGAVDCIDVAARFLAAQPGAVQRTLKEHRPRPDGRCRVCGPLVQWPCVMATIARAAASLPVDR